MDLNDVIFLDSLPTIDLHGIDRDTARVMINDFISDNVKLKNNIIVIIHGIGTGVIRNTVNETLKKNKRVVEFKSMYNNFGTTIAKINIE